jgi:5-hydroxyisourate hydrolase
MSGISTHVLDTSTGRPAANVRVRLFHDERETSSQTTDANGRCASLLPSDVALTPGSYRLVFDIGAYFQDGFYPEVSVSFLVRDASAHYHLPLLITPFGYTTYRGS